MKHTIAARLEEVDKAIDFQDYCCLCLCTIWPQSAQSDTVGKAFTLSRIPLDLTDWLTISNLRADIPLTQ